MKSKQEQKVKEEMGPLLEEGEEVRAVTRDAIEHVDIDIVGRVEQRFFKRVGGSAVGHLSRDVRVELEELRHDGPSYLSFVVMQVRSASSAR